MILILVAAFVVLVLVFGRAAARVYVDYLWHEGLGRGDVFWGVIRAKALLFVMFFATFVALMFVNLLVADRLAPTRFPANVHPVVERFHEIFGHRLRLVRYGAALVLGVLVALPTTSQWQSWLLYRNAQTFGQADAQFGADVGFYVFELPFLAFVLDWLFVAVLFVIVMTVLAHVLNGGVLFASPTPSVRPATKGHIAVLLALLAALKGADYWLSRYETTNERRGFVQGATYAVVNAQLPALMLLLLVALLTAGLYLSVLKTGSFRLPVLASALWLVVLIVGGYAYPAAVQGLVVDPNQQSREAPYITRNVLATRAAMGLDDVRVVDVTFDSIDAAAVEADTEPLADVRLLNPDRMLSRFRTDEGEQAGLTIDDLDVDRYELDGERQQVLIAGRELDLANIPNTSWQGQHLINTRGCGLVMAPVGVVAANDRPAYRPVELQRPELYFSPSLSGYAVAGTSESERACGDNTAYTGTSGVAMSNIVRRAAFALAFFDYNVLGSGAIEGDSQMLWVRNVRDRLTKLAPFLSYDGDPYPVVVDGGVQWVVDAYTSTSNYPYAQRVGEAVQLTESSGVSHQANYLRNSVKAVVDGYDGSVALYVVDDADPIVRAWQAAFPGMFSDADEMPAELAEHLRYPEDLFRVQTDVYSKYRLAPVDFFEREGAWSVAQAPSVEVSDGPVSVVPPRADDGRVPELAADATTARFVPYYTLFRPGADTASRQANPEEFVLLRPFVPFSSNDVRTQLAAYMTASSEPGSYGELTAYLVGGQQVDGPRTVANQIELNTEVARQVSAQTAGTTGNRVRFGDLQLVPISDGLLYVRPMYVEVQQTADTYVAEYGFVTVSHQGEAAIGRSLAEALATLFPGFEGDLGDRVGEPAVTADDPPTGGEPSSTPDASASPEELLAQADTLFREADAALADGNLGEYQTKVDEAAVLVAQAYDLLTATD